MKPFNLEEAKKGKPVCTRNGMPARIIATDIKNIDYPIAAVYVGQRGQEILTCYREDGKYIIDSGGLDLMMAEDEEPDEPKCPFKPFDKVLVRDTSNGKWDCEFFSKYTDKPHPFYCLHNVYDQCIPYNEETEHLVGTTDAPPEKYVIW